jgi:hypothetical protein
MAGRPIGDKPMTPAERKRRQRARELPPYDAEKEAERIFDKLVKRYPEEELDDEGNLPREHSASANLLGLIAELILLYSNYSGEITKEYIETGVGKRHNAHTVTAKVTIT